ncbi:MAG TPA: heavy-metal-associated domain-containing protein [Hellea balneolensis]|uniref:Heavy-metal-associated domain-containing protein n=1 Tax=Hellea balneolensis TaxID=287478 RepID=A0A7C5LRV1_9PROT|nr:heavy-metal-associated domain-containing protein [Hellea balneolensis]
MKKIFMISVGFMVLAGSAHAKDVQYNVRVDGMTCAFCAATSEKAIKKIKGVTRVSTDLDSATIRVCAVETAELSDAKLTKLLKKKGFTYVSKTKQDECTVLAKKKEARQGLWKSLFHKHS